MPAILLAVCIFFCVHHHAVHHRHHFVKPHLAEPAEVKPADEPIALPGRPIGKSTCDTIATAYALAKISRDNFVRSFPDEKQRGVLQCLGDH